MTLLHLTLVLGVFWNAVRPGVWMHEARMAEKGPLSVVRAVALRLDPALVRFVLDTATRDAGSRGGWSVEGIPAHAVAAFNAGQFSGGTPWGWLVLEGTEAQSPGSGSLAMAFVVDTGGAASLIESSQIASMRGRTRLAFQSYPALLVGNGELPWELKGDGRGIDLGHRDSRLAVGLLADGTMVVVLTRFAGLGSGGETLPWGPTVLEMAEYMKSLGCIRAMLLDGGISSQMALRGPDGSTQRWTNWRSVPLGMLVIEGAKR